jgi:glycosidase
MQGTPFIYQGEELGMTNASFFSVDELRDIEGINAYEALAAKGLSARAAMDIISRRGRDSARTPMQWTNGKNSGFTGGMPWIKINGNHKYINAEEELSRADSVYSYYRDLLALRKKETVFIAGRYIPVFTLRDDIMGYVRRYNNSEGEGDESSKSDKAVLVLGNFTDKSAPCLLEETGLFPDKILLGNIGDSKFLCKRELEPYEAVVLRVKLKGGVLKWDLS